MPHQGVLSPLIPCCKTCGRPSVVFSPSATKVLELVDLGGSPGGPSGRHWVLDPIDGTRGFVGLRQYAICLGMLQDGEVRRAVIEGVPSGVVVSPEV